MRRTLAIGSAVAVVVGTVAAVALADVDRIGGHVSINTAGSTAFKGQIKSSRKFCRNKRLVVIKRDTAGKDPIIARDRTNRQARYLADVGHPFTGDFYARATRKIRIVSGNGIVCRPLQTSVIHLD